MSTTVPIDNSSLYAGMTAIITHDFGTFGNLKLPKGALVSQYISFTERDSDLHGGFNIRSVADFVSIGKIYEKSPMVA
jgi:hypothetical protein